MPLIIVLAAVALSESDDARGLFIFDSSDSSFRLRVEVLELKQQFGDVEAIIR